MILPSGKACLIEAKSCHCHKCCFPGILEPLNCKLLEERWIYYILIAKMIVWIIDLRSLWVSYLEIHLLLHWIGTNIRTEYCTHYVTIFTLYLNVCKSFTFLKTRKRYHDGFIVIFVNKNQIGIWILFTRIFISS